jgi:probable F420-dependent oxidoreductase
MIDEPESRYPYSPDGRIAVPADADWLDPLIGLSFAAAATSEIRIATGILLLPEHNPVLLAKQAASLDTLCGGRLSLGVGIGWSADEFAVLGVPFKGRGKRLDEYVAVMRTLWRDDVASFHGAFINFDRVRVNPRPVQDRRIPIFLGGNSDAALGRAAAFGDGWYGFYLTVEEVAERLQVLHRLCAESQRDPGEVHTAVALTDGQPAQRERLAELGVDEVVLVSAPPADPADVSDWLAELAQGWLA